MIYIKQLEIPVDENVLVSLSQRKDRSPVLEYAPFDADLRLGVDIVIAFVLSLPGFGR